MNRGVDATVGVQVETSVRGRPRVDRVAIALRQELRAGRWRREQAHLAALTVVGLVYMSPDHGADVGMCIDDAPEAFWIGETHGVQPAAAHDDGMMVHADHGVLG